MVTRGRPGIGPSGDGRSGLAMGALSRGGVETD